MSQASAGLFRSPALAPLQGPVYRGLWFAWLTANLTMWMHDVSAAWLMTQLTHSPVMVALVSSASTLPVFLLGIASGAAADIVDRRRFFAGTQLWVCATATLLAVLALADGLNAQLLLLLTFVNGIGLALRWPVFSAIVPEVVAKPDLPAALALGGISMNLSRVIGPVLAGALLAAAGPAAVFTLNAVLAALAFWLIWRWKSEPRASALPGERFVGAMRVGVQHVWQSPRMKVVILRVFLFFLQSSAMVALLPLIAQRMGGGAGTYTLLMASLGAGAIVAALQFPKWRERLSRDDFVRYGVMTHAVLSSLVVAVPHPAVAVPAVALAGAAWISVANTLVMSAQFALPNWVRARGMSIYQMALMGGTASGAALWGQVAGWTSVPTAVFAAALSGVVLLYATRRASVAWGGDADLSPQPIHSSAPDVAIDIGPEEGPVLVVIEYLIAPEDQERFHKLMQATRRARLRQGALSWGLFRDTSVPGRYVESFVDENWIEHQRRLERFTADDGGLRAQRLALHRGDGPPRVRRYVAASVEVAPPEGL